MPRNALLATCSSPLGSLVGALGAVLVLAWPGAAAAKKPTKAAPTADVGARGATARVRPSSGSDKGAPHDKGQPEKKKAEPSGNGKADRATDKGKADKGKADKGKADKGKADKPTDKPTAKAGKATDKAADKSDKGKADKAAADKGKADKRPLASHVVQKGQTLQRIARRYRVSVDALVETNALAHKERLKPGLELVIPEPGREAEARKRAAELRGPVGSKGPAGKSPSPEAPSKAKAAEPKEASTKALAKRDAYEARPKKAGLLRVKTGTEVVTIQLVGRSGKLVPTALPKLSKALRFTPTGSTHPVDPRLAALLARVSDHFGGREIQVVSGFRPYSPSQHTPHSNHNHGKAVDFHVDGVPNAVLRDFCRTFEDAGVGYYPNSSFVHLDVRSARTYWIDYSGPGEAPRYAGAKAPPKAAGHGEKTSESEASDDADAHGKLNEKLNDKPSEPADSVDDSVDKKGGDKPTEQPAP